MKRSSLHYAILLLALTSCNKLLMESPVPDGDTPISFGIGAPGISVDSKSRAVVYNTTDLIGKDIAIFATEYPATGAVDWTNQGKRITNMNPATGKIGDPIIGEDFYEINYAPNAYYSVTGKHDFKMVYPMNEDEGVTIDKVAMTATIDLSKEPDLLWAENLGVPKGPNAVSFVLEHKLACVEFKIKKNPLLNYSIYLNYFNITGNQKATFDLIEGEFITPIPEEPKEFQVGIKQGHTFEITDEDQTACGALVFPTTDISKYTFKVIISQREHRITLPNNITEWEPGKKYTYTLTVNDANVHVEFVGLQEQEWVSVPEGIVII